MNRLLVQSVFAFLVLPGTVAFLIPLGFLAPGGTRSFVEPTALIPLGAGMVLLLSCVREFYVAGRGTLAPWHLRCTSSRPVPTGSHGAVWLRYRAQVPR